MAGNVLSHFLFKVRQLTPEYHFYTLCLIYGSFNEGMYRSSTV
jgi:hypothetical protein